MVDALLDGSFALMDSASDPPGLTPILAPAAPSAQCPLVTLTAEMPSTPITPRQFNIDVAATALQPLPPSAAVKQPATSAATPNVKPVRPTRRGKHLAGKPKLSAPARAAHRFWAERVLAVRSAWNAQAARDPDFQARYGRWANLAALRAGGKLESLVRTLHLAAAAGTIRPIGPGLRHSHDAAAGSERKGRPPGVVSTFSDWHGFTVAPTAADEFRREVWGLFPEGGQEETVMATLRQSGLAPDNWQLLPRGWPWEAAWAGEVPFVLRVGP